MPQELINSQLNTLKFSKSIRISGVRGAVAGLRQPSFWSKGRRADGWKKCRVVLYSGSVQGQVCLQSHVLTGAS